MPRKRKRRAPLGPRRFFTGPVDGLGTIRDSGHAGLRNCHRSPGKSRRRSGRPCPTKLQIQTYSTSATVFAHPKIADVSVAFHFVKGNHDAKLGGTPVNEYILRYPERMNGIENSRHVARAIAKNTLNENVYYKSLLGQINSY